MLQYFIDTAGLTIICAVITGMMTAYSVNFYGKSGRLTALVSVLAGIVGAAAVSYIKNTSKTFSNNMWVYNNFRIALVCLLLFLLAALTGLIFKKYRKADSFITPVIVAAMTVLALMYALPDVILMPPKILMTEKSVISSVFILDFIGVVFGVIFSFLTALAMYQGVRRFSRLPAFIITALGLLVYASRQVCVLLRIMIQQRMIISGVTVSRETYHELFEIVKNTSNNENIFTYLTIICAAIVPVLLVIISLRAKEPYNTPAEHRKIRWKWRVARRWAFLGVVCCVVSVLNPTLFTELATEVVELSPVEQPLISGDNAVVFFDQVQDGHLHRFGYTSPNGVEIRFIVIRKPNSSSYGIGLDACDICGETGYYEKDDQVVCKLCDVVMNVNTIGFKGGCNPIVIPYTIENGSILVPIEGLLEYESEFR